MKNTIVVNLFAGPGSGKSTCAAYVFSKLKMQGIDCELITEYAKEKVWEKNAEALKSQFLVSGKQAYKLSKVVGKVDIIIMDSPLPLGCLYGEDNNPYLKKAIAFEFKKYSNLNFFVERVNPFVQEGRVQNEAESIEIDKSIKKLLENMNEKYKCIKGNEEGYEKVFKEVLVQYMRKDDGELF